MPHTLEVKVILSDWDILVTCVFHILSLYIILSSIVPLLSKKGMLLTWQIFVFKK